MQIELSEKHEPLFKLLEAWNTCFNESFYNLNPKDRSKVLNSKELPIEYLNESFLELDKEDQQEWLELSRVDTILEYGGRDCFYHDQEVKTLNGSKKIGEIKVGDFVYTFNEITGEKELKKVSHTRSVKKKTVTINLKCGTKIVCTPDHKFYHNGCWIEVKDLLSLWYGDMEENKEV